MSYNQGRLTKQSTPNKKLSPLPSLKFYLGNLVNFMPKPRQAGDGRGENSDGRGKMVTKFWIFNFFSKNLHFQLLSGVSGNVP